MKAQCLICSELFVQTSIISATSCGHLFHHICLLQWNEQSMTCPNCRTKLGSRGIVPKLFLDPGDDSRGSDSDDDVDMLRNSNNELQTQLREMKNEMSSLEEIARCKDVELFGIEKQLMTLTNTNTEVSAKMDYYRSKVTFLQKENSRLAATENELVVTRKELETYSTLQSMLEGTSSEAEKILKSYSKDPASLKQLTTYCSLLQKELTDIRNSKSKMKDELKASKRDLAIAYDSMSKKESQIMVLSDENVSLRNSLEANEQELESANKKIEKLLKKVQDVTKSNNTSFDRIILESPAPQLAKYSKPAQEFDLDSPFSDFIDNPLKRRANENVLPRFKLTGNKPTKRPDIKQERRQKASSENIETVTLSSSSSSSSSAEDLCKNFNIFKRMRRQASSTTSLTSNKDHGYDGFGGHSRAEMFPCGLRAEGGAISKISKKTRKPVPKSKLSVNITNAYLFPRTSIINGVLNG